MRFGSKQCLLAVIILVGVVRLAAASGAAEPLTTEAYPKLKESKGVVLLAVRSVVRWKCGEFENAQLRLIAFDKLPTHND